MDALSTTDLLAAKLRIPQHVVYRDFASETVVLNLQTGRYHGLNATAGRMLEQLEQAACLSDAAAALADSYDQPLEVLERDICALCRDLLERGLVELEVDDDSAA